MLLRPIESLSPAFSVFFVLFIMNRIWFYSVRATYVHHNRITVHTNKMNRLRRYGRPVESQRGFPLSNPNSIVTIGEKFHEIGALFNFHSSFSHPKKNICCCCLILFQILQGNCHGKSSTPVDNISRHHTRCRERHIHLRSPYI
jgi:hypothetical protein